MIREGVPTRRGLRTRGAGAPGWAGRPASLPALFKGCRHRPIVTAWNWTLGVAFSQRSGASPKH